MTSPDDHPDMETGDPVLRELLQLRAGPGPTPSAELEEVFRTGIPAAPRRAWRQVWLVAASAAAVILAIEVATTSLAGSPAHQPPATVPTVVGVPGDPLPATDGPVGELVTPPAPVDEPAVPPPVSSPSDAALPVPDGPLQPPASRTPPAPSSGDGSVSEHASQSPTGKSTSAPPASKTPAEHQPSPSEHASQPETGKSTTTPPASKTPAERQPSPSASATAHH